MPVGQEVMRCRHGGEAALKASAKAAGSGVERWVLADDRLDHREGILDAVHQFPRHQLLPLLHCCGRLMSRTVEEKPSSLPLEHGSG